MTTPRDVQLSVIDQKLKTATRALIASFGGQDGASAQFGRVQSRYSDAGRPNTGVWLRLDEIATMEDNTVDKAGHPIVTRALAHRQGFSLAPEPRALPQPSDLLGFAGQLLADGGAVISRIGAAVADHRIDRSEASEIGDELDDLLLTVVTLRAAFRAIERGE